MIHFAVQVTSEQVKNRRGADAKKREDVPEEQGTNRRRANGVSGTRGLDHREDAGLHRLGQFGTMEPTRVLSGRCAPSSGSRSHWIGERALPFPIPPSIVKLL